MNKQIYDKIVLFKDKVYQYKELVSKSLTDIDRPYENNTIKSYNEDLLDLFYELKDTIYSEGNLQFKELHNQYQGNLGKIYDVALSNHYKYHIGEPLEMVYRDLKEITIKNKNSFDDETKENKINNSVDDLILENSALSSDENIQEKIHYATEKFLDKNSSKIDKENAIISLAKCLEFYRESIKKTEFVKEDESDLFNIANNFGIRHLNKNQKIDYDDEVFYEWIFLSYYNTLKLYLRLIKRRDEKI